ncbi:MAG: hypothetical protein KGJ90_04220 [Patescibacteria group bacterium]|nr:hypothetical protein [Patescibacteria group bacterium]
MNNETAGHPYVPNGNGNSHKKVGPIIATLVIVLVLIIAALYLFASRLNNQQQTPSTANTAGVGISATPQQSVQPITNKADDVQSLQADLNKATQGLDSQNF